MAYHKVKHLEADDAGTVLLYLDNGPQDLPQNAKDRGYSPGSEAKQLSNGQTWRLNSQYQWVQSWSGESSGGGGGGTISQVQQVEPLNGEQTILPDLHNILLTYTFAADTYFLNHTFLNEIGSANSGMFYIEVQLNYDNNLVIPSSNVVFNIANAGTFDFRQHANIKVIYQVIIQNGIPISCTPLPQHNLTVAPFAHQVLVDVPHEYYTVNQNTDKSRVYRGLRVGEQLKPIYPMPQGNNLGELLLLHYNMSPSQGIWIHRVGNEPNWSIGLYSYPSGGLIKTLYNSQTGWAEDAENYPIVAESTDILFDDINFNFNWLVTKYFTQEYAEPSSGIPEEQERTLGVGGTFIQGTDFSNLSEFINTHVNNHYFVVPLIIQVSSGENSDIVIKNASFIDQLQIQIIGGGYFALYFKDCYGTAIVDNLGQIPHLTVSNTGVLNLIANSNYFDIISVNEGQINVSNMLGNGAIDILNCNQGTIYLYNTTVNQLNGNGQVCGFGNTFTNSQQYQGTIFDLNNTTQNTFVSNNTPLADDKQYVRKNRQWVELANSGVGISEAPNTNNAFARKQEIWKVVEETDINSVTPLAHQATTQQTGNFEYENFSLKQLAVQDIFIGNSITFEDDYIEFPEDDSLYQYQIGTNKILPLITFSNNWHLAFRKQETSDVDILETFGFYNGTSTTFSWFHTLITKQNGHRNFTVGVPVILNLNPPIVNTIITAINPITQQIPGFLPNAYFSTIQRNYQNIYHDLPEIYNDFNNKFNSLTKHDPGNQERSTADIWYDNRPVYEYIWTGMISASANTTFSTFTTIPNIRQLINVNGSWTTGMSWDSQSNITNAFPVNSNGELTGSQYESRVYKNGNNIFFEAKYGLQLTNSPFIVVLKYTKQ